jgi:hypothetical protein
MGMSGPETTSGATSPPYIPNQAPGLTPPNTHQPGGQSAAPLTDMSWFEVYAITFIDQDFSVRYLSTADVMHVGIILPGKK